MNGFDPPSGRAASAALRRVWAGARVGVRINERVRRVGFGRYCIPVVSANPLTIPVGDVRSGSRLMADASTDQRRSVYRPDPGSWIVSSRLSKLGFLKTRQTGSHERWTHPDGRATTIPIYGGNEIGPPLFYRILNQLEIDRKSFDKLR
jgi:predicted RNA binding protein YcfA (HicA-like mRNA interferase family)